MCTAAAVFVAARSEGSAILDDLKRALQEACSFIPFPQALVE